MGCHVPSADSLSLSHPQAHEAPAFSSMNSHFIQSEHGFCKTTFMSGLWDRQSSNSKGLWGPINKHRKAMLWWGLWQMHFWEEGAATQLLVHCGLCKKVASNATAGSSNFFSNARISRCKILGMVCSKPDLLPGLNSAQ